MATQVANSTFGNEVFRQDGTRLYGMDAEVERKVCCLNKSN